MATRTRIAETPFLDDWFVISLRWLVVLGMTTMIAISGQFSIETIVALAAISLWNTFLSLLAILNRRLPYHRLLNLAVDWAVSLFLFFGTGGLTGPVLWTGLLAWFSSGIYFGFAGSMITAALFVVVQLVWALINVYSTTQPPIFADLLSPAMLRFEISLLVINLAVGGLVGLFSHGLIRALRRTYQAQTSVQKEGERKAQKQEHDRMQALYRLLETLSATLNYQVVLETVLDLSSTALNVQPAAADQIVAAVLLFDEHDLRIGTSRHIPQSDLRQTFPAERGALSEIVQTGEACLFTDPFKDPELGRLTVLQNLHSALALPLRRGLSAYGVMLFAHPDPNFFNPDRCEVLEVISHQAVIAIQNARLYQDVQQEKEHILEVQDETRKKLARDLHDGPTQSVSAIAMGLQVARKMQEVQPDQVPAELERLEDLARRTTKEIRHMLFTLRPLVLENEGLTAALQAMADKMRDTYGQNVTVRANALVEQQMDANEQTLVFYLAEEAVNNARKHAQAKMVTVRLDFLPKDREVALLEISDDGVGFDLASVNGSYDRRGSLGMVNLRERTDQINGMLNIDSAPGRGTCVTVLIPLTEQSADRLQRGLVTV